jgi:hypothetical protein
VKIKKFHIPTTKKARTRLKLFLEVKEKLPDMNLQNQAKQKNHRRGKWEKREKTSCMNKFHSFSLVQGPYLSQLSH